MTKIRLPRVEQIGYLRQLYLTNKSQKATMEINF